MYMVGGYYLAFFFSLSHNFEGVAMIEDTTREACRGGNKESFLYKQVKIQNKRKFKNILG